jgi:hypothetical protein
MRIFSQSEPLTIGYHLATISGKILMAECAIVDGKTAQPTWNSLKN